jgi:hypothetical protein
MKRIRTLALCIGAIFFSLPNSLLANSLLISDTTIFDVLVRDSLLEFTLEVDFKEMKDRKLDTYKSGAFLFKDRNGEQQKIAVETKPRGNMRRQICDFPPLKIKFDKGDVSRLGLKGQQKLELTTVCDKGEVYEQYILREYMIYKLYNMMTDYSFRVQLAKVHFTDTSPKGKTFDSYAILIESTDQMLKRLKSKELPKRYVSTSVLNNEACELFSIFQFMIGNTDWYVHNQHNVKILGQPNSSKATPVGYDFDYAGFVNTPYSVPQEELQLRHVTERYYQGYCRREEETMKTIQLFLDKKEALISYCKDFPYFDEKSEKHVVKYLEDFFETIENPRAVKSEILKHCDQWLGREK